MEEPELEGGLGVGRDWLGDVPGLRNTGGGVPEALEEASGWNRYQEGMEQRKAKLERALAKEREGLRHPVLTFILYPGGLSFFFVPLVTAQHLVDRQVESAGITMGVVKGLVKK